MHKQRQRSGLESQVVESGGLPQDDGGEGCLLFHLETRTFRHKVCVYKPVNILKMIYSIAHLILRILNALKAFIFF